MKNSDARPLPRVLVGKYASTYIHRYPTPRAISFTDASRVVAIIDTRQPNLSKFMYLMSKELVREST